MSNYYSERQLEDISKAIISGVKVYLFHNEHYSKRGCFTKIETDSLECGPKLIRQEE